MQKLKGMGRRCALSFEPFAAVIVVAFEYHAGWERGSHVGEGSGAQRIEQGRMNKPFLCCRLFLRDEDFQVYFLERLRQTQFDLGGSDESRRYACL